MRMVTPATRTESNASEKARGEKNRVRQQAGTKASDWTAHAHRPRRAAPASRDKDSAPPQRMHAHVARAGGKKGGTRTGKPPEISGR